jgi:acyl carrier protein
LNYTHEINQFIVENFLFGDDNNLKTDASLLENGIIDSTGVLELNSIFPSTMKKWISAFTEKITAFRRKPSAR